MAMSVQALFELVKSLARQEFSKILNRPASGRARGLATSQRAIRRRFAWAGRAQMIRERVEPQKPSEGKYQIHNIHKYQLGTLSASFKAPGG